MGAVNNLLSRLLLTLLALSVTLTESVQISPLPVYAATRPCQKISLRDYDHSMTELAYGMMYRDVQFHSQGDAVVVSLPDTCATQVNPPTFPFEVWALTSPFMPAACLLQCGLLQQSWQRIVVQLAGEQDPVWKLKVQSDQGTCGSLQESVW